MLCHAPQANCTPGAICLKIKSSAGVPEDVVIGVLYAPPASSTAYTHTAKLASDRNPYLDPFVELESCRENAALILTGDFNARTADLEDTPREELSHLQQLEGCIDFALPLDNDLLASAALPARASSDCARPNAFGKMLVEQCVQ